MIINTNVMNSRTFIVLATILTLGAACKDQPTEKVVEMAEVEIFSGDKADLMQRGEYMVNVLGCTDCHTPKKMSEAGPVPDMDKYLMGFDSSGGLPPVPESVPIGPWVLFKGDLTAAVGPWGTSFSGNLTPHETGIGTWSLEQFTKAIREAKYKGLDNSRPMMPPMPRHYAYLTDADIEAIFVYLQSIEPIENVVPGYRPPSL